MDKGISTIGLRRKFAEVAAVDGIDLEVSTGTFFGFLGPNGAGKSTTIKMLTGLLGISSGSATVLGFDIGKEPVEVKRRIGVVPEELALFDRLTATEYLRFVGRMHDLDRAEIDHRSAELLELMGLADEHRKLVVDFSHGMQKKLSFAASLIHQPQLLFLDEPFEGIDALSSQQIKTILDQLLRSGVTIFLTSHILEIVEKLCTHIAIIHRGSLVAQGELEELRNGVSVDAEGDRRQVSLETLFLEVVGEGNGAPKGLSWLD